MTDVEVPLSKQLNQFSFTVNLTNPRHQPNIRTHISADSRNESDVGSMMYQRRRRWANIEPTLGQYLVFAVQQRRGMDPILVQCWARVVPTLNQNRTHVSFFVLLVY